ncbi:MAG: acyltransferase [Novosphingobium sp.]
MTTQTDPAGTERFITAPMSACLDLIRFAAALTVLIFHSVQAQLYIGPFLPPSMAQHNAVVVFFVLSGLVITTSVQRRHGKLHNFALARAARIVPAALIAIGFGTAAFLLAKFIGAPPQHFDQWGDFSLRAIVMPMLFMSESPWGSGPLWNPPFWSLCYEVWYYALFGAAVFLRGWQRAAWLVVFAILAGPKVLLMLPVWLIGVALALAPFARRCGWKAGLVWLIAGLALCLYQTTLVNEGRLLTLQLFSAMGVKPGFSQFALTDLLLGIGVAAVFIGLRPLVNHWPRVWLSLDPLARALAGFSFTLYLFHWPLLLLIKTFNLTAGTNLPAFAVLLLGMTLTCYGISFVTERQRDVVRRWAKYSVLHLGEVRARRA